MSVKYTEIERHLRKTHENLNRIQSSATGEELRTSWEEFLSSFSRTVGRLISAGMADKSSRPWANRLKNSSTKDDEGLVFLREARNAAEHGMEPFATFSEAFTRIGGVAALEGNSSFSMNDCTVNGVKVNNFSVSVENGKVASVSGKPSLSIEELPTSIRLVPIRSDEKNVTFNIPSKLAGKILEINSPVSLAQEGLKELDRLFEEFKGFGAP